MHVLGAIVRIGRKTFHDRSAPAFGRAVSTRQARGQCFFDGSSRKRELAGHHFVHHHAYGEQVRSGADRGIEKLLWRHVGQRAGQQPCWLQGRGSRFDTQLRETEISDHRTTGCQNNVRRLEITVDDSDGVRFTETRQHLLQNRSGDG